MDILFYEPHVVFSCNSSRVLFFNLLDGFSLEFELNDETNDIFQRKVNNCFPIYKKELNSKILKNIVNSLEINLMGGVIELNNDNRTLPVIIPPVILSKTIKKDIVDREILYGGDLIKNKLFEITFYLDNSKLPSDNIYQNASRQFPFLIKKIVDKKNINLSIRTIKEKIFDLSFTSLKTINLVCDYLTDFSCELIDTIYENKIECNLFILFDSFKTGFKEWEIAKRTMLNIVIYNNYSHAINYLNENALLKSVRMVFLIKGETDILEIEKYSDILESIDCAILPVYHDNYVFFEENVFIDKESISNKTISISEIAKNELINTNFFGKIIIDLGGGIFSNMNFEPIGNLNNDNLLKIIANETRNNRTWRLLRDDVVPCKDCNYSKICPPISYYELNMNQNNLCKIFDSKKD